MIIRFIIAIFNRRHGGLYRRDAAFFFCKLGRGANFTLIGYPKDNVDPWF